MREIYDLVDIGINVGSNTENYTLLFFFNYKHIWGYNNDKISILVYKSRNNNHA